VSECLSSTLRTSISSEIRPIERDFEVRASRYGANLRIVEGGPRGGVRAYLRSGAFGLLISLFLFPLRVRIIMRHY